MKIYKQRIIDNFIADFYCHQASLVIELDGSQHFTREGRAYDEARSEVLERYGLYVLRFANEDVDKRFKDVCYIIDKTIQERLIVKQASPLGRGGAGGDGEGESLAPWERCHRR